MQYENTLAFAQKMDVEDPLASFRDRFYLPGDDNRRVIYFTGNSLGLQPKNVQQYIDDELKGWATLGVEGHFHSNTRPWFHYHKFSKQALAALVGAHPEEVVSMNSLTVNLHLLMVSFYRPEGKRFKIMAEAGAFPSDQYVIESQVRFHGYDPKEAIVELIPRQGEFNLRKEDIIEEIDRHGNELALIMLGGVQYFTGQYFDLAAITAAGHKAGCKVGFDLAHAVGNVPLSLHSWNVDFATWCSYKYLNSGPGSVAGIFVHEKYGSAPDLPRFAGWWGQDEDQRFLMKKGFKPMQGADGWQLSNVNVLGSAAHLASLEIFDKVGIEKLREKSLKLTGYLFNLITDMGFDHDTLEVITPAWEEERGCQLSILVRKRGREVFEKIGKAGIIVDWRDPDLPVGKAGVIRVAPVPLYNTFSEVHRFAEVFHDAVKATVRYE